MKKISDIISNLDKSKKDLIPGGLADKNKESDFDKKQLEMGIKVEMEHTNDPKKAKEIAMDHLAEHADYYTRLKEMEDKAEKDKEVKKCGDMIEEKSKAYKSITALDDNMVDYLSKGKKYPIGTIHNGYKKVSEGKWVAEKDSKKQEKTDSRSDYQKQLDEEYDKKHIKENQTTYKDLSPEEKREYQKQNKEKKKVKEVATKLADPSNSKKEEKYHPAVSRLIENLDEDLLFDDGKPSYSSKESIMEDLPQLLEGKEGFSQEDLKHLYTEGGDEKIADHIMNNIYKKKTSNKVKKSFDDFMCEEIEKLVK